MLLHSCTINHNPYHFLFKLFPSDHFPSVFTWLQIVTKLVKAIIYIKIQSNNCFYFIYNELGSLPTSTVNHSVQYLKPYLSF